MPDQSSRKSRCLSGSKMTGSRRPDCPPSPFGSDFIPIVLGIGAREGLLDLRCRVTATSDGPAGEPEGGGQPHRQRVYPI